MLTAYTGPTPQGQFERENVFVVCFEIALSL